jgi:hypothetical protein
MSRQRVTKEFEITQIANLCNGVVVEDFINHLRETQLAAQAQGFEDFSVEAYRKSYNDDDIDIIKVYLQGSRPETQEERDRREAKEAEWQAKAEKQRLEQEARSTQMARELAKGAVRGLTQEEVLALWREAQKDGVAR